MKRIVRREPSLDLTTLLMPYKEEIEDVTRRMLKLGYSVRFTYVTRDFAKVEVLALVTTGNVLVNLFIGSTMRGPLDRLHAEYFA